MKKVAVVTDSSADISTKQALDLDVHVVRMPILIDNVEQSKMKRLLLKSLLKK